MVDSRRRVCHGRSLCAAISMLEMDLEFVGWCLRMDKTSRGILESTAWIEGTGSVMMVRMLKMVMVMGQLR